MFRKSILSAAALAMTLSLAACGGGSDSVPPAPQAVGDTVALTASGRLISFNHDTPTGLVGSIAVSGLLGSEMLLGIDTRTSNDPATNGLLYGLGSNGTIYMLDPSTGSAKVASTLKALAGDDNPFTTLSGTSFGVDFNPVANRLRVVSNTGQNLRINVDTGDTITDGVIAPASAAVSASAYTNAFAGTTSTQLFNLNLATNTVDLQDPPNNGTLVTGAALGVAPTAVNGFDIDARNNTGYAAMTVGSSTSLYRINLAPVAPANAATLMGTIAGGEAIRGLALIQPKALAVTGLTTANQLVTFDPRRPNTLTNNVAITGLAGGETMLGMDVRPQDGLLWALSSTGRLYTLDAVTGAATFKVALAADATDTTAPFTGLDASTTVSVDFNPVANRLRVVTAAGQNLRIAVVNVVSATGITTPAGATTTDGAINRASGAASVLAAAYTNSYAGAAATKLYDIDGIADMLALQDPPNDGTLTNIGALGVDATDVVGLDIAGGSNGLILAAIRDGNSGPHLLRTVSLATGVTSLYANATGNASLSQIGGANGPALRDLAISIK